MIVSQSLKIQDVLSIANLLHNLKMGEVISVIAKELSCHDCARYVCNDASLHSRCCNQEECWQFDLETHPVRPPEEEVSVEVEVDNPGCLDATGMCCFLHASKK